MSMSVKMRRSRRTILLTGLAAAVNPLWPADESAIAVVVRQDVPVDNLTFAELRRLMLGDRQYWSSNLRVTLLMRAPGAREREVALKTIYQMSEAQFRQYWIAKVFRAESASAPRVVYSNEMAQELAAQIPGAVALVAAGAVPAGLKVLKINGMLPRDSGYPLH
jgi:ABC-type phosphate transport system substrate-binding protein